MIGLVMRLWKSLFERSPANTSAPHVQAQAYDAMAAGQVIERNMEMESAVGLSLRIGRIQSLLRGEHGELIRVSEQKPCLLGCGHIISQLQPEDRQGCHIRGLAGPCAFCLRDYSQGVQKGQISPSDAERLSLVCTDCARMTSSGVLCCPKHYTTVMAPDGSERYVDPDGAAQLRRQETVSKAFAVFLSLFQEDNTDPQPAKEEGSAQ